MTGGAFNGKRAWVKKIYSAHDPDNWISAYDQYCLPEEIANRDDDLLILEGIEIWVKGLLENNDITICRDKFKSFLAKWLIWEQMEPCRRLVVIGTDISKGIVPMEKESRLWRDMTGWVYQDLAKEAKRVDVIWYGVNQLIKEEKEYENLYKNR
ncbi:bifunctional adenosylcobinamide kinase/adenosylcobinamide-phosphate guanylyltransferase [Neobacillus endophyticus]|uniref:bifunctional adenosylcobinamide kinase/adenosylcobinamide-phosphate guanylyltransferase n=1 Tax=Neobacillus endophyticus TaxID=2738405 RepID=UPI0028AC0E30|nr:bifunctional adenosylcobinamide kinase/adenosylcobinamide-phosphate guanylyltransferase [Neobacillus endophyticus]